MDPQPDDEPLTPSARDLVSVPPTSGKFDNPSQLKPLLVALFSVSLFVIGHGVYIQHSQAVVLAKYRARMDTDGNRNLSKEEVPSRATPRRPPGPTAIGCRASPCRPASMPPYLLRPPTAHSIARRPSS